MTMLLLISLPCIASIYMQKDADGDVSYSDIPLNNAEPISLSPTNSVPATKNASSVTVSTSTTDTEKPSETPYYNSFKIISPANNESIQNQPVVTVKVATDPEFRAGDTVQVYLDGKPWGVPTTGTSIDMINVDRGEHTLYAILLDSAQQILKQSDTIKIFVHRVNTNFKPADASQTRLADLLLQ